MDYTVLMIIHTEGIDEGEHKYAVFIKREIEILSNAGMKIIPLY